MELTKQSLMKALVLHELIDQNAMVSLQATALELH